MDKGVHIGGVTSGAPGQQGEAKDGLCGTQMSSPQVSSPHNRECMKRFCIIQYTLDRLSLRVGVMLCEQGCSQGLHILERLGLLDDGA